MRRIPRSTYRLQLHKGFTFDDAAAIAPYLKKLGVSHVYSSPYLQAAPGSMHGYDVVDHRKVNAELGGEEAHARFSKTLGEVGLGQVLDIVPNHMSLGEQNRYWWDVLENGTSSRYASFFDIDWQPQEERLRDKVLVPVLGDQYGRVLASGGINVARHGSSFVVECAGQTLPVSPNSLPSILMRAAEYAKSDTLSFLAASYGRLPSPEYADRRTILARHRDKGVLNTLLDRLCGEEAFVCEAIDRAVTELNANHDALDDLLNQQNYRLAYWKTADQQLGYRRFFDVNTLIGLRVEREHVFEETHALILEWLDKGVLDGVRVDHPDGLRDPLEYFRRLRERAPDAWIIGEKILEPGEYLRENWPIDGTSGYDFLNVAAGVLVSSEGMVELDRFYGEFSGQPTDFPAIAHDKKIAVASEALGSDVNRLASLFVEICEAHRDQRDYTRAEIRRAIREVAGCFSVYRTYVVPSRGEITEEDRAEIKAAVEASKERRQDIDAGLFDFIHAVLTMASDDVKGRKETEFLERFQQFTSPVMAKGVEDTAFYCYNRLTGMNEVGSDPGRNGLSVGDFHAYCAKMQATHPETMTTLGTHDTKRSDDVRARLAVLCELPQRYAHTILRWAEMNAKFKQGEFPDCNTEVFYYQTLIGAWPITNERMQAYMQKAMREAKQQTSWVANNKDYEDALSSFIEQTLASKEFVTELEQFVERVQEPGRVNSLSQNLMRFVAPGVPDIYQGTEVWDFSLVDPDNRRPVDYSLRAKLLDELQGLPASEIMARAGDGLPKLWLSHQALMLRRDHPEWFGDEAEYCALHVEGSKREHVVAFSRGNSVVAVAPRLSLLRGGTWDGTTIALPQKKRWLNVLTGESFPGGEVELEDLLREFPVALMHVQD